MKNLGKEINKAKKESKKLKLTKENLKQFTPERILSDLKIVNNLVNKMNNFDETIKENEAEKLEVELEEIESYLLNQYKDYIDLDGNGIDVNSFKDNVDTKE